MLRKSVFRLSVLAAFLLLPLAAQASPVTFSGNQNVTLANSQLSVSLDPISVNSNTTAITTITLASIQLPFGTFPESGFFEFGIVFNQPSVLDLGLPFHFTTSGNQAGVTFTVTQPGTQNITLGGVNYLVTFGLSGLSLSSPGQSVDVTLTLTPSNPVPEPTTMLLLGSGLVGIAVKVRKRRKGI